MEKIKVKYFSNMVNEIKIAIFTKDVLTLWKTEPCCIDIMDCETGEMLYIKGLDN